MNNAKFDVEHALSMYARSFCTLPASYIYDKEVVKKYEEVINSCHIYIIGYLQKVRLKEVKEVSGHVILDYDFGSHKKNLMIPLPPDCKLVCNDGFYYAENPQGDKFTIPEETTNSFLREHREFDVRYVGQAYGKDGSRNSLDRLLKHETLQRIALTSVPEGKVLSLLLLEIEPSTQLVTVMNPHAKNKDDGSRIQAGLDKLFNTTEAERVSLYEASLIRYFYPQFNKEFKDSFPSTRLKILQDCYDKDFSLIVAEISIDELPFQLCSEKIPAKYHHFAKHDLHQEEERKAFFYSTT